jgi:hypothetical protein
MSIIHLVLFRFKLDNNNNNITSDEQNQQITSACNLFLELKEKCVNPETMEPYLLDVRGGKDCSPEGIQVCSPAAFLRLRYCFASALLGFAGLCWVSPRSQGEMANRIWSQKGGITHAFVVEFAGESDRDYYLKHDPAHLAFVEMVGSIVEKVQVIDFVPGKF